MKNILFSLFIFSALIIHAQKKDDAIKWNNQIIDYQVLVFKYDDALLTAITDNKDVDSVSYAYFDYLTFLNLAIKVYEYEEPFDRKDIFRKAILDFLYDFKEVLVEQYAEIVYMYFNFDTSSETEVYRWDTLAEEIDSLQLKANNKFLEAQKKFAKQYDFILREE